ncbi:MAG: hypothetical protein R2883_03015 [Caldisericia bacterium]
MRKFLVLLLTLTLVVGFSACGNNPDESETSISDSENITDIHSDLDSKEIADEFKKESDKEDDSTLEIVSTTKEVDGKTYFVSEGLEMLYPNLWVIADMTEKSEDFYFIQADKFVDEVYMDMVYTNIFPDAETIWDMPGPFTDEKILAKFQEIFDDVEIVSPIELAGQTFTRFKTLELRDVNDEELGMSIIHFAVVGDDSFLIATGTNEKNLVNDYYSEDSWNMLNSMVFNNVDKSADSENVIGV